MNPSVFPAFAAGSRPFLSRRWQSLRALFPAILVSMLPPAAVADEFYWDLDGDGDWANPLNWWPSGPPVGAGDIVHLADFDITAGRTITLGADQTLGILNISDSMSGYFPYAIGGTGTLIFNNSGGAQINKIHDYTKLNLTGANPNNGLNLNTAHDVIGVPIELQSDLTIRNNALNGVLEFTESIGNDETNRNVIVRGPNLGGSTPGNQGGKALVVFSSENTYGGTTTINDGGRLRITHGGALGTGNIAQIAGGGSPNSASSLELAGGITVNNHVVTLSGTDSSLDTVARIASVSGHNTFAGNIQGIGTGGSNYPIHSVGAAEGDFFTFSGNIINSRNQADNIRNLRFGGAGRGEVTGDIYETSTSSWAVFKDHAGIWTLSGENSYRGATTVRAGTLRVNGTHTGSGAYTVVAGGRLEVNGSISDPDVNVNVNVGAALSGIGTIAGWVFADGAIAPGNSVGTLATGRLFLTGTYELEIDGDQADKLVVDGDLDLQDAALSVTAISPPTQSSYVIATYTGDLVGEFSDVPPGYKVDTESAPGEVILVKVSSGTPYGTWIGGFPSLTEEADREPEADPDGDGIPNAVEYVLGGDPTQSSLHLLPQIDASGGDIVFAFQRDDASIDGSTEVTVQYGTDLSGWTDVPVPDAAGSYGMVEVGENGEITVTIPKDGDAKKFVRLKVEAE